MYGFTLIITLAIVGGVIAYIGDRLGMNVGRKKLTLFGLRPKHTSILVTIVTGVFIASASIGVLTIASQDVRTALFRMKEIQEDLALMQKDYAEMELQRDTAQRELQEAEERVGEALADYDRVILALAEAEAEVEVQKISMEENQLTIAELETRIGNLQKEAASLQTELLDLEAKTEEFRQSYLQVSTAFGQIREANIAFNASEVILTTVVPTGLTREEIRVQLEEFMLEVDEVAYRRSARVQEAQKSQNYRDYKAIFLQAGILDLAVEHVLLARGNVIVRAVSESNTIPGVPVVVYLENYPDQMVFSKGTVLAKGVWDPRGGIEIDQVILEILREANETALNAGMALSEERGVSVLLPGDDFLDAIFASKNFNQPVQVRLVVSKDTWRSTTPVHVYLELTP